MMWHLVVCQFNFIFIFTDLSNLHLNVPFLRVTVFIFHLWLCILVHVYELAFQSIRCVNVTRLKDTECYLSIIELQFYRCISINHGIYVNANFDAC